MAEKVIQWSRNGAEKSYSVVWEWSRKKLFSGLGRCTPGSQLERLVKVMICHIAIHLTAQKGDSFNFCPWSTETLVQPGHGAPKLYILLGQLIVGSGGGGKGSGNYSLECTGEGYWRDKEQRGNTRCACSQCSLFLEHQQTTNPLFHPYWFVRCQCLCPCQVLPINNSVTQLHDVPKKGRLS